MIVNINHKVSCCVQQGVVIVDRGESRESQSVMSRLGRRGDSGHNLQGLVLCPGERGDSGQERITKYHVFRKARR